ncbi:MAG: putative lipoprotein YmbA [Lentisphaeria bacterium]|jgi:uncharacterized lipoprotein YmbA
MIKRKVQQNNWLRHLFLVSLLGATCLLIGCMSSGPATKHYSLFAAEPSAENMHALANKKISLGIGPIILPEYLQNPAIVSLTPSQQVRVSGYHAWAGDLNEALLRVLAADVSTHLQLDGVWAFPWDNRVRPDYQVRIVVEHFSGIRGQDVVLTAKWTLLNKVGDELLLTGREQLSRTTRSGGVDDYVGAMNVLINEAAYSIAEKLALRLSEVSE